MAITEKSRHQLYQRLERILGPDEATTLMDLLPPVGWADVATKEDLRHLESRLETRLGTRIDVLGSELRSELRAEMANVRTEMANLSAEFHSTLRTNTFLLFGGMAALTGAGTAITALT